MTPDASTVVCAPASRLCATARLKAMHHNSLPTKVLAIIDSRPAGVLMRDLAAETGAKHNAVVIALWRLCNRGEVVGRRYEHDRRAFLWGRP